MRFKVHRSGLQTHIQDQPRDGFAHYGISPSGPADIIAYHYGNYLVHNKINTASLEIALFGPKIEFLDAGYIAITGSKFLIKINDTDLLYNRPIKIEKGQLLDIRSAIGGARCYLSIAGGIDVEDFLNSKSTHLETGVGGFDGRALKKNDIVNCLSNTNKSDFNKIKINYDLNRFKILITKGLQHNFFSKDDWKIFLNNEYTVSPKSNRMGIRLECGNKLNKVNDIITEGIPLGAIQVPPNGLPIISFVEHQTTGGYPKIANVISADIPKLGQLMPGDKFNFELIDFEQAIKYKNEMNVLLNKLHD